jgi:hypothetical protein
MSTPLQLNIYHHQHHYHHHQHWILIRCQTDNHSQHGPLLHHSSAVRTTLLCNLNCSKSATTAISICHGRQRNRTGTEGLFYFAASSLALVSTHPHMKLVRTLVPRDKADGMWKQHWLTDSLAINNTDTHRCALHTLSFYGTQLQLYFTLNLCKRVPWKEPVMGTCWHHLILFPSGEMINSSFFVIRNTNLIHTSLFTLLRFTVSACFGHYLPILRRHYTNAGLVTGCGKTTVFPHPETNCVCVVPPENGQVIPETCRDCEPQ